MTDPFDGAGELLLGLRYFRNNIANSTNERSGELLLGLPYLRNCNSPVALRYLRNVSCDADHSRKVKYCLVCGTSETAKSKWIEDHYGELLLGLRYLRNLRVAYGSLA